MTLAWVCLGVVSAAVAAVAAEAVVADAVPADEQAAKLDEAVRMADAALAAEEQTQSAAEDGEEVLPDPISPKQINLLDLLSRGGWLMVPIGLMSLVVVTFGLERWLGLRRRKVLPPALIHGLGKLAAQKGGLDPRKAYRLCQQRPSAAANVIRTMLLKVGRPHTEVEHAVAEASDREAARLYSNVRWLSLAAGVTPLLGLLGTVWGMIQAFFATANLPTGANKAEYLAQGIYVALVTTFAGLAVAIPAAVLAHLFEGRIQTLFRELDETLLGLMPQLERYEGRLRVSAEQLDAAPAATGKTVQPPPVADETRRPQPAPVPK
jgi:biopolymer transport protein ExbB